MSKNKGGGVEESFRERMTGVAVAIFRTIGIVLNNK